MDHFQVGSYLYRFPALTPYPNPSTSTRATDEPHFDPSEFSTDIGEPYPLWQHSSDAARLQSPCSVTSWGELGGFFAYGKDQVYTQKDDTYKQHDRVGHHPMQREYDLNGTRQTSSSPAHHGDEARPSSQDKPIDIASPKQLPRRGRPRKRTEVVSEPATLAPKRRQYKRPHHTRIPPSSRFADADEASDKFDCAAVNSARVCENKKVRLRLRNREAAHKYRQKKQRGITDLQTQEAVAEAVNQALFIEASALRGKILLLKNMILQHGNCDCPLIQDYIGVSATNMTNALKDFNLSNASRISSSVSPPSLFNASPRSTAVDSDSKPFNRR